MGKSIALGLLSFPSIFLRLGMVGGVITTVGPGILAHFTAWIMVDFSSSIPVLFTLAMPGESSSVTGVDEFLVSV